MQNAAEQIIHQNNKSHSPPQLTLTHTFKEDPQFWSHDKLLDVCQNSGAEVGFLKILEANKYSSSQFLRLDMPSMERVFDHYAMVAKVLKEELIKSIESQSAFSNIDPEMIYMSESQELSSSVYQMMIDPSDLTKVLSVVPPANQTQTELSGIHISKIHQTQYSSPLTVSYSFFDYDEYPRFEGSLQVFNRFLDNPLFQRLQDEYEEFLANKKPSLNDNNTKKQNQISNKNYTVLLKLQINNTLLQLEEGNQYKLGSNQSQCNIYIASSQNISEIHATISSENNVFYIADAGSEAGTYIRSEINQALFPGTIFTCGQQQFQVEDLDYKKDEITVEVSVQLIHSNMPQFIGKTYQFKVESGVMSLVGSIGKAVLGKDLIEDSSLAKMHSKLILKNQQLYIQDLNQDQEGTWIRLSPPLQKSEHISLSNVTELKLGTQRIPFSIVKKDHRNIITSLKIH